MNLEIDLDALLADRKQIAVIWDIDDVKETRPDLTDEQAWEVLTTARDGHDSNYGITWESLEWIAESLFGEVPEEPEEG